MIASVCVKYGGPEVYQMKEVEKPNIKDDQVLVQVKQAIVSPTDVNFRSGKPLISRLFSGVLKPKKRVHGEMFWGEVVEVGSDVKRFSVGDKVYGSNGMKLGAYAEYVAVHKSEAIKKIPDDINPTQALTLLDGGITALPFLKEKAGLQKGQSILIIGASGAVGSMAVMVAKHIGAIVTGVCSETNLDMVTSLGADHVIDYTKTDYTKEDKTYDVIFDAVGKSSYSACKPILTNKGIYVTTFPSIGILLGAIKKENKEKKRGGFMAAGLRKPDVKIKDLHYLEGLVQNKELAPYVGKEYTLNDLGEAQRYVETGHKVGNVIINITT